MSNSWYIGSKCCCFGPKPRPYWPIFRQTKIFEKFLPWKIHSAVALKSSIMIDKLNIWSIKRNKNTTPFYNLLLLNIVQHLGSLDNWEEAQWFHYNPHLKSNPTMTFIQAAPLVFCEIEAIHVYPPPKH